MAKESVSMEIWLASLARIMFSSYFVLVVAAVAVGVFANVSSEMIVVPATDSP